MARETSGAAWRGTDRTDRHARPKGTARARALALLATRWRSEHEVRRRLQAAGFPQEEVEEALAGLDRAGLIDDARFAREVVRDQSTRRRASARAMTAALRQKGVPAAIAETAVADAGSDSDRALALAESRARRLTASGPEAAYRRLYGLLVRRGYTPEVAREACRAALAGVIEPTDPAD